MGRKGLELTTDEKESIIWLSKANVKLKEISNTISRPISTICSFLKRHEATGKLQNKVRSGRPGKGVEQSQWLER